MRHVIRVVREDSGQACSNEQWAAACWELDGVAGVTLEGIEPWPDSGEPDGPVRVFPIVVDADCPPDAAYVLDATRTIRPAMMFASNVPSDVDAYLDRQRERMGHTTDARHG